MPKTKPARAPQPAFLANAQTFYGQAFDHKSNKAIARSMSDWAELDEDEQSFAQAHLLFLNLQAQAATQRLFVQVRDLLDEVAESLTVALETSLAEVEEAREGPEDHGDPEFDDDHAHLPPDAVPDLPEPEDLVAPDDEPDEDDDGDPNAGDDLDADDDLDDEPDEDAA